MNKSKDGYKNLGYANGWDSRPKELKKCEKKGHKMTAETIHNCVTEYACNICKIKYQVDSSG